MGSKLYVGNINYATTEDELRDLFGSYGPVSAVDIVRDRYTGQSKGFSFVHFLPTRSRPSRVSTRPKLAAGRFASTRPGRAQTAPEASAGNPPHLVRGIPIHRPPITRGPFFVSGDSRGSLELIFDAR
mgnify:CR=1 FL=1